MQISDKKKYYELSAKFLLEELFGYDLEKSEHPDFHDRTKSIGIEVTQAMSKQEGEMIGFTEEIKDKKLVDISANKIENFEKLGGKIFERNGVKWISFGDNLVSIDRLIAAINRKQKKLSSKHFTIYQSNQLFLFSDRAPIKRNHVEAIVKGLAPNSTQVSFDLIHILSISSLWTFSPDSIESIIYRKIPKEILYQMSTMLAQ